MDVEELRRLIRDLESENIELKPSLSQMREIVESAAAFAGARGGKIIVGVADKGKVLGVQIGKDTIETLSNKIRDNTDPAIYPSISVVEEKGKDVIVIGVKESHRKPVLAFNRPFKRVGKSTVRMNRDEYERTILEEHKEKLRFDSDICKEASLEDIDKEKVRWFLRKAKKERGFDVDPEICVEEALMRLKLLKGDKLTNSAVLLFGKQPQNLFLQDRIRCARFKGVTPIDFIDMKIIEGNLFDLLDATEKFILSHIRKAAKIVMFKREEAWEYPPDAIREAIVNALIHRDYWVSGNIRVSIYDDRVEITNPGELLEPLTPEMLKKEHESILRNPLLANAFFLTRDIEQWGRGTNKIVRWCVEHGLKEPDFEGIGGGFMVKFHAPVDILALVPDKTKVDLRELGLNERQVEALKLMVNENTRMTNKQYCEGFNVSRQTATRDLQELVGKNQIAETGKGRGRYYVAK